MTYLTYLLNIFKYKIMLLNINVIKNQPKIQKPKSNKQKQLMPKPLPFNMNFWKNNNPLSLPSSDQNREYLINKSNKSPLILTRPFNKKVIRFHNKNSSEILNPNKIKYFSYFRQILSMIIRSI